MLRIKLLLVLCLWVGVGLGKSEETIKCSACKENNVKLSSIIIPAESDPVEKYAADELAKYIKKMTGQSLPIVVEDQTRPKGRAIVVGRTKENLQAHNPDSWPVDTIYIGYGKGDIAIIGQGDQGTLFAAYQFLRDQGCRWYIPREVGEHIPTRTSLDLPDKAKKHTPSFRDRGWNPAYALAGPLADMQDWAVRNGVNSLANYSLNFLGPDGIVEYPSELGYGSQKMIGHMLYTLIPSSDHPRTAELFAAHPEWYPLVNGQRVTQYKDGRPVQACLSNPKVVEAVAQHVIEHFRQNPRYWLYSIAHNDEPSYWCECEACCAMDGPQSTWKANDIYDAYPLKSKHGPGPMSTRYVKFVNEVAKIVGKEMPDRYISFCAYGSVEVPPQDNNWKLESNVIVEFSHGCEHCLRHGLDDINCETNANMVKWISGWTSRGKVLVYDYPPMGPNWNLPTGFTHSYKRYLVGLKKLGVIGFAGENQTVWGGSGLYYYIKARLLWDIDTDVDQLVSEFCRDMYGLSAPVMEKFYNTFEQKLQEFDGHLVWGRWVNNIDDETLKVLSDYLTKALQKSDTALVKKRIKMVKVAMNSLMMLKMQVNPAETLQLIEDINEPFPLVVTGQHFRQLKNAAENSQ